MYKNFEDIVKKDNPKLNQGGQLKIVVDTGATVSMNTNNVIDYTKKNPYFSSIIASKKKGCR